MRTVKNILESKAAPNNFVAPNTLVIDALNQLSQVNLSYLIVMEDGQYKGIFSERDYSRNVILKGRHSNSTPVQEVMTTDLPKVQLTDTVEHCMNAMNENKTRYLLAYDADGGFAGVVTIHDLLRQVISNREDVFDSSAQDSAAQQWLDQDESGMIY